MSTPQHFPDQNKPDKDLIINELKSKGQIIKKIDWQFLNLTFNDALFAMYLTTKNKPQEEIPFSDLNKKIAQMCISISDLTKKTTELDTLVKGSDFEDELIISNVFKINDFYRTIPFHNFLVKPNTLILKQNYCPHRKYFAHYLNESNPRHIYGKMDYTSFLMEDEISTGIDYKHDNNKVGFFLQNTFFFKRNYEILKKFKYSLSKEDVKRNKEQKSFKFSLVKNFNERTFLFRENLVFDPIKKLTFSYAHKNIENNFDDANSSLKLKTETPQEDAVHQFKFSYKNCSFDLNPSNFLTNKFDGKNMINNNVMNTGSLAYKISSSFNTSLNSTFIENKLFMRKVSVFSNSFIHQLNIEGGNLVQLNKEKNLKIHEYKYLNNFKGINNPGEKAVIEEGKTGDCLGNSYYIALKNKILYNNIPLISNYNIKKDNFEILPFTYWNILFCGNEHFNTEPNANKNEYSKFHSSIGFGVNVLTDMANVELYYNLYSKKNKFDISPEFGVNIGFD